MNSLIVAISTDLESHVVVVGSVILSLSVVIGGILGGVRLFRTYISNQVDRTLDDAVKRQVKEAVFESQLLVLAKLDGISEAQAQMKTNQENIREVQHEMSASVTRIAVLEKTIENGMTLRLGRVEDKVDRLLSGDPWNGTERRAEG